MRKTKKRNWIALVACILAVLFAVQAPAQIQASDITCSKLYDVVKEECSSGAKKVSKLDRCTLVSYSYRKKVDDFYYAADSNQVYCVCIVKAEGTSAAKEIKKEFDSVKKEKKNDSYLKAKEKKQVKTARCGRSGSYVWYICLGSKEGNKKAEKALKEAI